MLDIGFYNFPDPTFVETQKEAARAVASTRYPPEGIRERPFLTARISVRIRLLCAVEEQKHHHCSNPASWVLSTMLMPSRRSGRRWHFVGLSDWPPRWVISAMLLTTTRAADG